MEFFHGVESTCLPYLTRTAHSASLFESRCVSRLLLSQLRPPATLNLIFIHHCFNKQRSICTQVDPLVCTCSRVYPWRVVTERFHTAWEPRWNRLVRDYVVVVSSVSILQCKETNPEIVGNSSYSKQVSVAILKLQWFENVSFQHAVAETYG